MHLVIILALLIIVGITIWIVYPKYNKDSSDVTDEDKKKKKVTFSPDLKTEYYQNFNDHVNDSVIKYIDKILPYDLNAPKKYEITMDDISPFEQPIQGLEFNADYKSTLKEGCNYM